MTNARVSLYLIGCVSLYLIGRVSLYLIGQYVLRALEAVMSRRMTQDTCMWPLIYELHISQSHCFLFYMRLAA